MSFSLRSTVASCSRRCPSFLPPTSSHLARSFSLSPSVMGPKVPARIPTDVSGPEAMTFREAHRLHRAWQVGHPSMGISIMFLVELDKKRPSMRGRTLFPRSTALKEETILVFCTEEQVEEALDAGATYAGGPELFADVKSGKLSPDNILCTTTMIDELQRNMAKVLGPRNMMPNAKRGSVFENVTAGVEANRGAVEWKVDQNGAMGILVGRASWPYEDLEENLLTILEDLRSCGTVNNLDISKPTPVNVLQIQATTSQAPGILISDILTKPRPRGF
ncbi:ribosomal protein L1-like protein [Mrakia frigida]|uniref:mitochondrial 54S ribosomal protein uL1m MRPL1 n=1 Tax=Mrakia frigida TaxID=29902 RepID=UPI003FCC2520